MNRKGTISKKQLFRDNLFLDFKLQQANILAVAVAKYQSPWTDSYIITFKSPRTHSIGAALYSYKQERIVAIIGNYYADEGTPMEKVGIKIPSIAVSTYSFPFPVRKLFTPVGLQLQYFLDHATLEDYAPANFPIELMQGTLYRYDQMSIQLNSCHVMDIKPILN